MSTQFGVAEAEAAGLSLSVGSAGGEIAARSPMALFWRRFRQDRIALASLGFIVLIVVVAFAAPLVVKLFGLPSPYAQSPNLLNDFGEPTGPSSLHPLGVDNLGRDIASRIIYGTRVSLEVGVIGTAISAVIGVVVGLLAGYYRGWVDTVLSRVTD